MTPPRSLHIRAPDPPLPSPLLTCSSSLVLKLTFVFTSTTALLLAETLELSLQGLSKTLFNDLVIWAVSGSWTVSFRFLFICTIHIDQWLPNRPVLSTALFVPELPHPQPHPKVHSSKGGSYRMTWHEILVRHAPPSASGLCLYRGLPRWPYVPQRQITTWNLYWSLNQMCFLLDVRPHKTWLTQLQHWPAQGCYIWEFLN